jgi:ubiquinone/menaquinone biosynthesis C-methylase UbiE
MNEYYDKRAKEYEDVYRRDDSIRQTEQIQIKDELKRLFAGKSVLEIACGTGYWTECIAEVANSVTGVDTSNEVLEIAKLKNIRADFIYGDAYNLENIKGIFNAGCANFWFSHIEKERIDHFLNGFHKRIKKDSPVFMADNRYIEGIGGKLIKEDNSDNTYKIRKLSNGREFRIIKNYFEKNELQLIFERYAKEINIIMGQCFWWIKYIIK